MDEGIQFRYRSIYEILKSYEKIIIYGTGNYAHAIYPQLVNYGLKDKISNFTQTKKGEIDSIDGIPVVCFEEMGEIGRNCVVLIAVSEVYITEIRQMLSEKYDCNVISLIDYKFDYKRTEDEFHNLTSFEEYCEKIADWYVETHADKEEKEEVLQELLNRGSRSGKEVNANLIIMICGHISSRSNKIIRALVKREYHVIMLNYCRIETAWNLDELKKTNIPIYKCQCIEELLYRALQYNPLIYFFEPRWGDCLWAEIMFRNKRYFGKVVLALYDVLNDGFADVAFQDLSTEKYALENADGIVWRWFSKEYLEEKGFQYQGKSIQFLDYCDFKERDLPIENVKHGAVRLCEVAGVASEFVEKTYNTKYVDSARVGEILKAIGNREDCMFHFYAGSLNEKCIEQCMQYEEQYSNFKFFVNVEHDDLMECLSNYDFGCDFYTDGEFPPDDMPVGRYKGSIRKNCVRNILFDYLSAGLPIITTTPQKFLEYLEPYNVVIKMNVSNIDIDYLMQNKCYYRKNVLVARRKLSVDNEITRLANFFRRL